MFGDAVLIAILLAVPVGLMVALRRVYREYKSRSGRSRWPLLLAGNVLVTLLLASLVVIILEGYFRFWHDSPDSFGLTRSTARWFDRHYQLNTWGVRDNVQYAAAPTQGRRRVTFLGDSFTAGHGVADVEDRFANRIRHATADRWEVHVLAENGHDTGQQSTTLAEALTSGYHLDDVLLVYCPNDVSDLIPQWQQSLRRTYEDAENCGFFVRHSYFLNTCYFRLVAARQPEIADYYHFVNDAYEGPVWQTQQQRLLALRDLCRAHDGRLLVVLFPFLHQLDEPSDMRTWHAKLAAFWDEAGVPCLDLLPLFEQHRDESLVVSRYDAHPNPRAHALAADAILRFLTEQEPTVGDVSRAFEPAKD